MQKTSSKKKKQIKPVTKPYLKGAPLESSCVKSCLFFFLANIGVMVGFLIMGSMMIWDNLIVRILTNGALMLCMYCVLFYSGMNKGTVAVNLGEILYQRREKGLEVTDEEQKPCFHPVKGLLIGLLGTLPLFVCALVLATTTQRQMTGFGTLPSWTTGLLGRAELGDAVAYYQVATGLQVQDVLRLIVRICVMPVVNMIGVENPDGLMLLERLSPVLVLIPAISYGLGYLRGVSVRTRVHTSIEENKRKSKKKQSINKKKQQKKRQPRGPEQLN